MRFDELEGGSNAGFDVDVSAGHIEDFVRPSGVRSPIHVDDEAARQAGFAGRVVLGFLIGVHVSRETAASPFRVVGGRGSRLSSRVSVSLRDQTRPRGCGRVGHPRTGRCGNGVCAFAGFCSRTGVDPCDDTGQRMRVLVGDGAHDRD